MSSKPKYNWKDPSLFTDDMQHPANMELREIRTGINKHGEVCRNAVITKTKEYFIEQARAIWGDRYDYSDSEYISGKAPIRIRCKKHNHYFIVALAQNHIMKPHGTFKPTGCPVCTYEEQYNVDYGTDWRKYLEPCARNSRMRLIKDSGKRSHSRTVKTPEQIAAEKAAKEAKAEARRRQEQAYLEEWNAKNLKEAHFLEKLQRRYPDMYGTTLVDFKDKDKKVTLICPTHGEFSINARQLFGDSKHKAHGCWRCAGLIPPDERTPTMTADEFFQRMHQLYDATELDFMTSEFHGIKKKVTAYCRKHGAITHYAEYWLEGKGCEYCNGQFYPPDFLQMARKAQGQEYTYRGVNKITSASSRVMVHCGNPDHKWHRMLVSLVLQGCKCRECAGRHQSLDERKANLLERVKEKFGDGHFLIAIDEYTTTHNPITVTCLDHNYTYKIAPDILLNGAGGCPLCSASEGEAVIKGWLDNHGIPHTWHAQIPNEDPTLPLQYVEPDFWLEHLNLYIEYHGEQHYENIGYFYDGKRIRNFAVQQHRDCYLRDYCQRHGHRLLEIPYWDFKRIDEILTDELLNINT